MVQRVTAIDRYTVRFDLKQPFGSFLVNLFMGVVPAGSGPSLRWQPVGSGPYRFVRYLPDDRVELAPFAGYFGGAPKNAGVTVKIVPDDIMRGLERRKGTVDLIVNDLAPDIVHQLRRDGSSAVIESPGTDYQYVGFNMRDPILRDRRVRHAIGYAIDREAIIRYLRRGLAMPAVGILPPMSWAFAPDVFTFTHDPARARRLLDEAGYPDPDGDGPRPRLTLSLKTSSAEFTRLQAAVIQEDLREVGIALDLRSYEFATLYEDVQKGNFQMFTLQWVGVTDPDMLRRVFHSSQVPPAGLNRGHFSNAAVDRLIDAATVSLDENERRRLYGEAQRLIAYEAPYISLWYKVNVAVASPALRHVNVNPAGNFSFLREVCRAPCS
jgi:peptide/nickel transport system substrate-binding protein